jgi:hypothetical protein
MPLSKLLKPPVKSQVTALHVIDLKDSAHNQATSENLLFILSPEKAEAICFESQELEDLASELSSGRIALDYLPC